MNSQKGCCDWFFRCFKGNSNQPPKQELQQNPPIEKQKTIPDNEQPNQQNNPEEGDHLQENGGNGGNGANNVNGSNGGNQANPENGEVQYVNIPVINTVYTPDEIMSHIIPDKLRQIKYNCPICMKYYNYILVLQCCKNYLCYHCIHDYIESSQKYNQQIKCPHCMNSDRLHLEDVDLTQDVKLYSDTLYGTTKKPFSKEATLKQLSKKESNLRRAVTKQHKLMRRRYSIENGVLFDINRHSVQSKIDNLKSQTIHHPKQRISKIPSKKPVVYDQTGVISKPELKNTVEMDGIELNFKKSYHKTKSKLNCTISHQSAYSFEENFEVHSQEIDDQSNEEFYFERDNDNNLIEILEQKIQNDYARKEKERRKEIFQSGMFRTVKLGEPDNKFEEDSSQNHGYFKKHSVDNLLKNCKTEDVKLDVHIEDQIPIYDDSKLENGNPQRTDMDAPQISVVENNGGTGRNEEENPDDYGDNIVDLDEFDQGEQGSQQQEEGSKNEENNQVYPNDLKSNNTEEVNFDLVSRRVGFEKLYSTSQIKA